MFFNWRQRLSLSAAGLLALFLLGSCARAPQPGIQRLAILRFENLSPDPDVDWMGRAFADVITTELSAAPKIYAIPTTRLHALNQTMGVRPVSAPGISAEAQLALASGANRFGYGEYSIVNGRLRTRLTVEDVQGRRVAQGPFEAAADAADVLGAATTLARQISGDLQPYSTRNSVALEAYAKAVESPDAGTIGQYASKALAADPNFGLAYVMLTELKISQQDRAGATALLEAAAARGNGITQADRIRLEIMAASVRGDRAALGRALSVKVQTTPADPDAWRSLAGTYLQRRQFPQAIQAFERALAIEPEDANSWNQIGYAAAYNGDLDTAMKALRRYQAIRPADPNALDSMGDVNFLTGHLQEAERFYLDVYQKAPAFLNGLDLEKAAMARLMRGDVAGSDGLLKGKGGAEWLWATGRRKEAYAKLANEVESAANLRADIQARGYAELAIWSMLLGDRDAAARMAEKAAGLGAPPNGLVTVARFVTLPPASPAEWTSRANQMFPNAPPNSIRDIALSDALMLDGNIAAAAPILKQLDEQTAPGTDRSTAIELAWALVEAGNFKDAAPLLRLNPIPSAAGMGPFFGLYFPRLFQLRALVAEKEGKADEARENRRIYAALGGT